MGFVGVYDLAQEISGLRGFVQRWVDSRGFVRVLIEEWMLFEEAFWFWGLGEEALVRE